MIYLRYFEGKKEEKILFLIYLVDRRNTKWRNYVNIFRNLDIDWWVEPNGSHHRGLVYQSILNTDDLEEGKKISNYIKDQFDEPVLICLSKGMVSDSKPVGESQDKDWVKIGRVFDKMVSENKRGIYVI